MDLVEAWEIHQTQSQHISSHTTTNYGTTDSISDEEFDEQYDAYIGSIDFLNNDEPTESLSASHNVEKIEDKKSESSLVSRILAAVALILAMFNPSSSVQTEDQNTQAVPSGQDFIITGWIFKEVIYAETDEDGKTTLIERRIMQVPTFERASPQSHLTDLPEIHAEGSLFDETDSEDEVESEDEFDLNLSGDEAEETQWGYFQKDGQWFNKHDGSPVPDFI